MKNIGLRILIEESGIKYKDLAFSIGITPEYLSRLMAQDEIPEDIKGKIFDVIGKKKSDNPYFKAGFEAGFSFAIHEMRKKMDMLECIGDGK